MNHSSYLPWIVACYATKVGESVWLKLPAGLSEDDLAHRTPALAAACWARKATVNHTGRNASLVRVDIERRDPHKGTTIDSPLVTTRDPATGSRVVNGLKQLTARRAVPSWESPELLRLGEPDHDHAEPSAAEPVSVESAADQLSPDSGSMARFSVLAVPAPGEVAEPVESRGRRRKPRSRVPAVVSVASAGGRDVSEYV